MDVELHILPLAETSKFVTRGKRCGFSNTFANSVLPPSDSPVSPLDELLEDFPSQAVTDLHYVWLQRDRHINSRSSQGIFFLQNNVIRELM